VTAAK
jgi:hypothetical protein